MSTETVLEVERLSRAYRTQRETIWALRDVELEVRTGEIVGLLGVNGAGKTTMLKVISTLLLPTSGRVRVGGLDVVERTREARRLMACVFGGERGLYNRLSGRDNARFFAALAGVPLRGLDRRVDEALARTGLGEAAGRPVETYSRGMKQRLHLAIGVMTAPRLLLLDEPTIGLDPIEAARWRDFVAGLRGSETAILLTSHNLGEIERLADRIVVIDAGRITHDLPLDRLLARAHAAAEVALVGSGRPPLLDGEGELSGARGVRVVELVEGSPSPTSWTVTFEVERWTPESLRALASAWPDADVVDVRVQPIRLEHVFAALARSGEPAP